MTESAIRFLNVTKNFKLQNESAISIIDRIRGRLHSNSEAQEDRYFPAIKDVSFDIKKGETIGFVGTNGSGKSTMLKLAAGIINPTQGEIEINGRLSALLELGAGFHLDLTGRENIRLGGALLGLSADDVAAITDDVIAFSELGNFIEIPVKHYSSGMFMRLAFSVAVHVLPEILFIDEILAVGDQAFQDKCFQRLHEFKRSNVTMIIVSHDLRSMQNICERLIWIDKGEIRMGGEPRQVLAAYTEFMRMQQNASILQQTIDKDKQRWGSGEIRFKSVRLKNGEGNYSNIFRSNEAVTVEMVWEAKGAINNPQFGLSIFRVNDQVQLNSPTSIGAGLDVGEITGCGEISYHIDGLPLLPGAYYLTVSIHDNLGVHTFDFIDQCVKFEVSFTENVEQYGFVSLPARWEFETHE